MPRRGYTLIPTSPSPDGRGISPIDVHSSILSAPSTLDPDVADDIEAPEDSHGGVAAVEAAEPVFEVFLSLHRVRPLCISHLARPLTRFRLASYFYSLDNQSTSSYLSLPPLGTSDFGTHSLISSILPTMSLTTSVGYLVIATAPSVGAVAVGIILYAIGYTYVSPFHFFERFLSKRSRRTTAIDLHDYRRPLKCRGLVSGLIFAPSQINAVIGSKLADAVHDSLGWRRGYGMFAIIVPVAMAPLILPLFWGERQTHKQRFVGPTHPHDGLVHHAKAKWVERAWLFAQQLVGLVLLGAAVALILLPMTLGQSSKGSWSNPSPACSSSAGSFFPYSRSLWDIKYVKRPVIARKLLSNRTVVFVAFIEFFDFVRCPLIVADSRRAIG
ncbi:MFS general substrate transporter [Ganoderma sinense ZZ0214-1]|uniref:MFS general substrate transporter n=1 Tax=Ganoderma sinense ZZ0214-1 TaxID=1077348 RepID=A0A2G8SES4_9APHY|nr:MFS general substrate transporter [Ganoderma sinense ZZ0214-1]